MTRFGRAAVLAVVAVLALAGLTAAPAHAGGSQAVVIVDTGSGTYTRVISFDGTISGYDALVLAGAAPTTYGFAGQGVAVCQLFGVGNPADDSCLGTAADPSYWAYYRSPAGSGGWQYSRGGAGATSVSDGDVEGWRFGAGGAPGYQSFCAVAGCAPPPAPAPEPAPVPVPGAAAGSASAGASTADPAATGPGGAPAPATDEGTGTGAPDATAGETAAAPTTPSTGRGGAAPAERSRAGSDQALGRPVVVADEGAGSPIGVLVAVALVALLGMIALVVRRRRAAGPAD